MPSTFLGLNTGLSGLNYYQAALNTTGHNSANANIKGYTRQQVLAQASGALRLRASYGMMGTGVSVTGIQQIRSAYYDNKYRAAMAQYNEYNALNEQLSQLQSYLNEMQTESGYSALLTKVDKALQDLSTSPSDAAYRTQFIRSVENFLDLIKETANNYQKTQKDINDEIAVHVDDINSISRKIYSLNQQILGIETRGGNANDLRDERERLVDRLSELVNVTVIETPIDYGQAEGTLKATGTLYEVWIGNDLLVDNMECKQLMVAPRLEKINQNDIDGLYDIYWAGRKGTADIKLNFHSQNVTGKIKGLLEARDGNNGEIFGGTVQAVERYPAPNGNYSVAINLSGGPILINRLNLPEAGTITINGRDYYYEGWNADYNPEDGEITGFRFLNLETLDKDGKRVKAEDIPNFDPSVFTDRPVKIGREIKIKGIPYYQQELNKFVRTFSKSLNDIFTKKDANGDPVDANGDPGIDFFTALDKDGIDFKLYGSVYHDLNDKSAYRPLYPIGAFDTSYYKLTALNWSVNSVMDDTDKLVVSYDDDIKQGNVDAKGVLDKIMAAFSDRTMFRQGMPTQFLQSITTSLAVSIQKYEAFSKNMDEVSYAINNQRLSLSGVDANEEAANLIVLQQGYDLSCKIISVMNEVYDKLINQTG